MNDLITNKNAFSRSVITLLVLSSVWIAGLSLNEFKKGSYIGRDVPAQNIITVNGKGEILAKPDIATFYFTVTEEGSSVADAQKKSTGKTNTALALIKKGGVDEKDIKTTNYNINPKYEYYYQPQIMTPCSSNYCPPTPVKNPKIIGYEVSQTIEIKVRKIENSGDLLSQIATVGVSNISGLTFSIDDEEKVKADARNKAITEAKEKAKVLASQLGVSLVRVVNFSENANYPIYYGRGTAGISMKADSMAEATPEVPSGENSIISNVTITYEIR